MELIGLTPDDHAVLARVVAAFESGSLSKKPARQQQSRQRIYEAIPFINASGQTIPAYGLVRLTTPTTVDGEQLINVNTVDATYRWRYLVNGPDDVDSAGTARGWGTWLWHADKVLYDTGSTPAEGEEWGPKVGEFKLFQYRPGFIVDGRKDLTAGFLWAMQVVPQEVRVQNDTGADKTSASGSVSYSLFGGSAGTADLGLDISATNDSSVTFKSTKYGSVGRLAGRNQVVPHQT